MQIDIFDQERNAILAAPTNAEFAERLRAYNCRRCELADSRAHIVVDRGNPQAPLLVISERPGENEDATGLAFVGRAGEMLDKILASIGLDSNRDALIVNVAKCKPAIDRSPTSAEAEACLPYLERQIELVRPRVVLLLGAVALKWIDPARGEFTMEEEAGHFFTLKRYPGIQFMVLYHPAFLLRDPSKKRIMWEHMKLLRDFLRSAATALAGGDAIATATAAATAGDTAAAPALEWTHHG
jgi:DNA polymerase